MDYRARVGVSRGIVPIRAFSIVNSVSTKRVVPHSRRDDASRPRWRTRRMFLRHRSEKKRSFEPILRQSGRICHIRNQQSAVLPYTWHRTLLGRLTVRFLGNIPEDKFESKRLLLSEYLLIFPIQLLCSKERSNCH